MGSSSSSLCCRGQEHQIRCMDMLKNFVCSLSETILDGQQAYLHVFIGIDQYDVLYDRDDTREEIKLLFANISIYNVKFVMLRSHFHFRGKMCKIWEFLAIEAVKQDCSFFVLLGDNILL